MAYSKKTWKNSVTKLNAANLNTIESGLEAAATKADEAAAKATANTTTINGHTTAINGLTTSLNGLTTTVNNNKTDTNSRFTSVENRIAAVEQINDTQNSTISTLGTEIIRVEGKFDNSVASLTSSTNSIGGILREHQENTANPHSVTAEQVGAYTKVAIDDKLTPTKSITLSPGLDTANVTTINDINAQSHKVILELGTTGQKYVPAILPTGGTFSGLIRPISIDCCNQLADAFPNYVYEYSEGGGWTDKITIDELHFVYPTYSKERSGWHLATSHWQSDGGMAYYDDSEDFSDNEHVKVCLLLKNDVLKKFYILDFGSNYSSYESFGYYDLGDKIIVECNYNTSYLIDLSDYPEGTEFYTIGLDFADVNNVYKLCEISTPDIPYFALYDSSGGCLANTALFKGGRYEFDIASTSSSVYTEFYGIRAGAYGSDVFPANATFSYLPNNSNLAFLVKHISKDTAGLDTLISKSVKSELTNLITTGIADPDASTPGLLYFKYLP